MSDNTFRGEDESAGAAHPVLDLAAGIFLLALGIWFAVMSVQLPVPGRLTTAPGLLPFLTAASLAAMAAVLGLSAFRRLPGAEALGLGGLLSAIESRRRAMLIATVVIYVAALDALSFETYVHIGDMQIPFGSFEPVTLVSMAAMLRIFWTRRLTHCVAVAVIWTLCLSLAFRGLFNIPMPG